jgi:hypothetical protein
LDFSSALRSSLNRALPTTFNVAGNPSRRVSAPSRATRQHLAGLTPTPLLSFASLQHIKGTKVHLPRALPTRYVPPPGFGYPLDGFLPSNPRRLCFTPTALLGFALRSFPPSKGIRNVSEANPPTYRFPGRRCADVASAPARPTAVPGRRSFRESLAIARVFSANEAGCSLGIHSSRAIARRPCRVFARSPLTRLPWPIPRPEPHLKVSIGLRLAPSATRVETRFGQGDPHRVSAPVRS